MIKGKIFTKMVATYFFIMISTLTMLGILLSFLLSNYFIYNKQMEMLVKAKDISDLVKPFLIEKRDPGELIRLLNRADKNLGTEIWVIDRNGMALAASADQKNHEGDLITPSDVIEMQQGKIVVRQGRSQIYRETVLWVITPVKEGNRVIGGVILYSPILGITQTLFKVRNLFIYSAAVSILFSIVIVYVLSKYLTEPLQEMSQTAKLLAGGELTRRVHVKQGDEIGDLGEAFNDMADKIEKQEKMRRDFVADVSHELKTPLTNIQGFIEAMIDRKDKTPEDRERYLNILYSETTRLTRLVNELLDLSRLESGRLLVDKEAVEITEVINSSIAKIKPLLEEKGIKVITEFPGYAINVLGNSDRLEQVITNLLDNAHRFSPPGGEIRVTVKELNTNVEVTVKDWGEGIPADDLPLIWGRFYRVDKARSREKGGTGLGLAIVKRIIESFGGEVVAFSEPGKGAEIGFILPVYQGRRS